jgi:hypothetical protein
MFYCLIVGYAEGSSIADSLKQFARRRSDIFGSSTAKSQLDSGEEDMEEEKEVSSYNGDMIYIFMTCVFIARLIVVACMPRTQFFSPYLYGAIVGSCVVSCICDVCATD